MKAYSPIALALISSMASLDRASSAAVNPVPEFTGNVAEGFENVAPPGGQPAPLTIFGGAATVDDTITHTIVITTVWQGWGPDMQIGTPDDVIIQPYNGNLFAGAIVGSARFVFNPPVSQFGGFFTTVGNASGGAVVVRNAQGAELASLSMTIEPGDWNWQGWSSDVPIGSIEITSNNPLGEASVQFDDLQITQGSLCEADISPNGQVDVDDLLAVISGWGPCPAPPATCPANIVNTGTSVNKVDVDDLLAVISAWGVCP